MITIMKSGRQGIQTSEAIKPGCWVHLIDPSTEEIERVGREAGVPAEMITSALDVHELPRVEHDKNRLMVILRVAHLIDQPDDIPYTAMPLGVIVSGRVVVSVCKFPTAIIDRMIAKPLHGFDTARPNRFILALLMAMAVDYLNALQDINEAVDRLEDRLQKSQKNKEVLALLQYQKSLTHFTTALRSNKLMLDRLEKINLFDHDSAEKELLEDVLTEMDQALAMTEISSGILSQMMDAFASIISNNLNMVMKFMTALTMVLSLPMLVASIYGMNVDLPLAKAEYAFEMVIGGSALAAMITLVVFWRRGWL
jgi:magnesium transporter